MKVSGIYLITCLTTTKVYIGSSKNIYERWKAHKRMLRRGNHDNIHFQRAWNKYGENDFLFEIWEKTEKLQERETYWIYAFDAVSSGFNIDAEAYRTAKNGEANGMYGKKHSESTKLRMSLSRKARKLSKVHKTKLANILAQYRPIVAKKRQKKLKLISPDGEIIEFNGYKECCRITGINSGGLSHLRRGIRPTMKGWKNYG